MDESMLRYIGEFKRLDFHNIKTIKFVNADDFDEFEVAPSTAHRRMIMNAVAKLQTSHSKLGWSGNEKKQNILSPQNCLLSPATQLTMTMRKANNSSLCINLQLH
jgi:hypothetical protein